MRRAAPVSCSSWRSSCTPPDDRSALGRRHLEAARRWGAAGDTARSLALLERAVAVAPPGSERAEALIALGRTTVPSRRLPGARRRSSRGRSTSRAHDVRVRVALENGADVDAPLLGDLGLPRSMRERAVALAEELGDRAVLVETLGDLGLIQMLRRRRGLPRRRSTGRSTLERGGRRGSPLALLVDDRTGRTPWRSRGPASSTPRARRWRLLRSEAAERGDEQASRTS